MRISELRARIVRFFVISVPTRVGAWRRHLMATDVEGTSGPRPTRLQSGVQVARQLASRASRRHPLVPPLAAALLAALLALVLPLAVPNDGPARRAADGLADGVARQLASEDLAAFRTSARWGISLQAAREKAAADRERARLAALEPSAEEEDKDQAAWSPELQAIGFVGVVITASERVVLLTLPAAEIGRFHAGDVLEDGRTLASISAQALVLQHEDGQAETLPLFPPVPAIVSAESSPTQGE